MQNGKKCKNVKPRIHENKNGKMRKLQYKNAKMQKRKKGKMKKK